MGVRNSAKAVIIRHGKLLTIKKLGIQGIHYILPGGGQDHGETLVETLKRECLEEVGLEVDVNNLLCVREYIGANHEFASNEKERNVHALEFMYSCTISSSKEAKNGEQPDVGQIGIEWISLDDLHNESLYPRETRNCLMPLAIIDFIIDWKSGKEPSIYLGDVF
jgi:8-oxo-dGTP diphosphatase